MSKILNLQSLATLEAYKSKCIHKHGALITKGNRVYASGCNDNMRGSFQGKIDCCMHAEMSACNRFINSVVRSDKEKYCLLQGETYKYTKKR